MKDVEMSQGMREVLETMNKVMGIEPHKPSFMAALFPSRKIVTSHVRPPIPIRQFDWCAFYDGEEEEGNYGYGATEQEAIRDLIASYPSQANLNEPMER